MKRVKLTLREMRTLVKLAENNFIVSNAALDLNLSTTNVSQIINYLIKKLPKGFFIFREAGTKGSRKRLLGITDKARDSQLFRSIYYISEHYDNVNEELNCEIRQPG